jgi:actin
MSKLLMEIKCKLTSSSEMEIVRDIKEKLCFVTQDYEEDLKKSENSSELDKRYELPDGEIISINN